MKITDVRNGLATALDTVSNLTVYRFEPKAIADARFGVAIVGFPDEIRYQQTMGGTPALTAMSIPVEIVVSDVNTEAAQDRLSDWLASDGAIRTALINDPTLSNKCSNAFLDSATVGTKTIDGNDYLSATLNIIIKG